MQRINERRITTETTNDVIETVNEHRQYTKPNHIAIYVRLDLTRLDST